MYTTSDGMYSRSSFNVHRFEMVARVLQVYLLLLLVADGNRPIAEVHDDADVVDDARHVELDRPAPGLRLAHLGDVRLEADVLRRLDPILQLHVVDRLVRVPRHVVDDVRAHLRLRLAQTGADAAEEAGHGLLRGDIKLCARRTRG